MGESHILHPEERVELIMGQIIRMSPIGTKHANLVDMLNLILVENWSRKAVVRVQNPITLGDYSEHEPDIVIAKAPITTYKDCHPGPEDILLLIEVASSSLPVDNEVKLPLYASFGIPCVWIVDIDKQEVTCYTQPQENNYVQRIVLKAGKGSFAKLDEPSLSIAIDDLF